MPENQQNDNKSKALQAALSQIQKQFGKGSAMLLGSEPVEKIPTISTGSLTLDVALGIGGLPKGRVIEIYGNESSGKTTLTLHAVAECQRAGGTAAFIDAEHALDVNYAKNLGVDADQLVLSQPDHGEQALEIADMLARSGAVDLIVIDSVAALTPRAEIEGEMGDQFMGLQARLMSQALRKITGNVNKGGCAIIFINQIRMKIGVVYGNPETTTGGNALKFYSSVRLEIRKGTAIKEGDTTIGNEVRVKVVKNKVAPPFKEAHFDIIYNKGVNKLGEILDLAVDQKIVDKAGSWYSYGTTKIGQGRQSALEYFRQNDNLRADVENKVLDILVHKKDPEGIQENPPEKQATEKKAKK